MNRRLSLKPDRFLSNQPDPPQIAVAALPYREARRARKERVRSMSIALHHALEMVQTLFEAVEKMPAQALLEEEPIGPPIALARESLASAIALGVDDATLQTLALNIGGLIGALQWNADLIRGSSGTRPKDFLEKNEPLRRSLESMLKFLEDHWTAKLK